MHKKKVNMDNTTLQLAYCLCPSTSLGMKSRLHVPLVYSIVVPRHTDKNLTEESRSMDMFCHVKSGKSLPVAVDVSAQCVSFRIAPHISHAFTDRYAQVGSTFPDLV